MKYWLRKIIIILPVLLISLFYLRDLYHETYDNASFKRVAGFVISILLLYVLFVVITIRRRQDNFLQGLILSSFFVYLFFVLQLTGYFILFKEVSSHGWWDKMMHRVETHDHVNFDLFNTINRYDILDKQVAGNFVMLLPLGIYLPLLYRKLRKASAFFTVTFISFIISVEIELLQLATSYRSTDVDDVMLNTAGAMTGFLMYQLIRLLVNPKRT